MMKDFDDDLPMMFSRFCVLLSPSALCSFGSFVVVDSFTGSDKVRLTSAREIPNKNSFIVVTAFSF